MDARWTKKNEENHYGYKNHVNADETHKRVQSYAVTDAAVHDSQVFEALLDYRVVHANQPAVFAQTVLDPEQVTTDLPGK